MPDNNSNFVGGFNQTANENRNDCGCRRNDGFCGNCGCGCGCGDSTILFFIIVFLLLFTNFGCCGCCRG